MSRKVNLEQLNRQLDAKKASDKAEIERERAARPVPLLKRLTNIVVNSTRSNAFVVIQNIRRLLTKYVANGELSEPEWQELAGDTKFVGWTSQQVVDMFTAIELVHRNQEFLETYDKTAKANSAAEFAAGARSKTADARVARGESTAIRCPSREQRPHGNKTFPEQHNR